MPQINLYKSTRFTVVFTTICITFVLWFLHISKVHDDYWGGKGKDPQGTIYAVQTVEANIAAASLPYTIASIIKEGKFERLPDFLNISFGLTGYAVTTCEDGSNSDTCLNETLVGVTESWFVKKDDIPRYIEDADFNILTDNHALGIDWSYKAPKVDKIIEHAFNPEGNVIGRLYYLRWDRPQLHARIKEWVTQDYLWSSSGEKKYYGSITLSYLFFMCLFIVFQTIIYKKFIETKKLKLEKKDIESRYNDAITERHTLESDKNHLSTERERLLIVRSEKEKEIEEIKNRANDDKQEISNLEAVLEEDSKKLEEYEDIKTKLETTESKLKYRTEKLKDAEDEVDRLNKVKESSSKKSSQEEKLFQYFLDGINTLSRHRVIVLDEVFSKDMPTFLKHGLGLDRLKGLIERLVKTDLKNGDFRTTYETLKNGKFKIYHNKKSGVRIYFTLKDGCVTVAGIWSADDAPHENSDPKMSELTRRLEKVTT